MLAKKKKFLINLWVSVSSHEWKTLLMTYLWEATELQESAKIREMNKPFSQLIINLGFGSLLAWKNAFIFPKDRDVENVCDTINLHLSLHETTSNLNGDHQWWYFIFFAQIPNFCAVKFSFPVFPLSIHLPFNRIGYMPCYYPSNQSSFYDFLIESRWIHLFCWIQIILKNINA